MQDDDLRWAHWIESDEEPVADEEKRRWRTLRRHANIRHGEEVAAAEAAAAEVAAKEAEAQAAAFSEGVGDEGGSPEGAEDASATSPGNLGSSMEL